MDQENVPCGVCDGKLLVKSHHRRRPNLLCPRCHGSGLSTSAFDIQGKRIVPGALAKILPRAWPNCPDLESKTPGYKGMVRAVYTDEGGIVVELQADPYLSSTPKNSKNHGTHCARPWAVKLIKGTAQSRRVALYKEKRYE